MFFKILSQNNFMNRIYYMKFFVIAALLFPVLSQAHPVTFKGGSEIAVQTNSSMQKYSYTYSFSKNMAIGYSFFKTYQEYNLLEANYLLKRFNEIGSQGNIYTGLQLGFDQNDQFKIGSMVEADWESRVYYISGKYNHLDQDMTKFRLGYAPYLTSYDGLHTWLMLEHVYMSQEKFQDVSPLVRVFYDKYLAEIGYSLKGNALFNFMMHF